MASQPVDAVRVHIVATTAVTCTNLKPPLNQRQEARNDKVVRRTEIACWSLEQQQFAYIRPHYWRRSGAVLPFRPTVPQICTGLRGWEWHRGTLPLRALSPSLIYRGLYSQRIPREQQERRRVANERRTDGRINCNASVRINHGR